MKTQKYMQSFMKVLIYSTSTPVVEVPPAIEVPPAAEVPAVVVINRKIAKSCENLHYSCSYQLENCQELRFIEKTYFFRKYGVLAL